MLVRWIFGARPFGAAGRAGAARSVPVAGAPTALPCRLEDQVNRRSARNIPGVPPMVRPGTLGTTPHSKGLSVRTSLRARFWRPATDDNVTAQAGSSAQPAAPAQPNSSAQTATLSPSSLSFVAGAISGAAGQAVGHPLDTLNIHAQAGRSTEHLRLWSLWRGASVPVMTVGSINSLALGVFENVRRALWPHESPTPLPVLAAAGTSCGLAVSVVTCPLSRVKILQQLTGARFFVGVQRCLESRSLFRAYPTAAVPTTPNSAPPEPCWPQP